MNFLSHYYLHSNKNDNFYTVGLTIPDLLGFHSRRVRITKINIKNIANTFIKERNPDLSACLAGMYVHLEADKWFHNLSFFKEKVSFLQNNYISFNKDKEKLPSFYAHIIFEILLDRYLLTIQHDIADRFYDSYKAFDFEKISILLGNLKNFDKKKFLSLAFKVSHSTFLKDYTDNKAIIRILERVSNRINLPMFIEVNREKFANYIGVSFDELKPDIIDFFKYAENKTKINKDIIIKSDFNYNFNY